MPAFAGRKFASGTLARGHLAAGLAEAEHDGNVARRTRGFARVSSSAAGVESGTGSAVRADQSAGGEDVCGRAD